MTWTQNYDPLGHPVFSTLVAALPVVVLLSSIAWLKFRIHYAALLGLIVAAAVALLIYRMPAVQVFATTGYGAAYGLFPIGWIILNLIFLYQLTVKSGLFAVLRDSLARIAPDPRIQVILIAFCFGAFFEGAAGFGTPVAVTAAILMQLGFKPLPAAGLSLIANTAPVAFGALGTPILALEGVTGIDKLKLSAMVGRQLPFFSLVVPFWVVCAMSGWRGMLGIWPAALTAGICFAVPQFVVSNYHGPWLVDIVASLCSMGGLVLLLKFWKPKALAAPLENGSPPATSSEAHPARKVRQAWAPWMVLSVLVFIWGIPAVKKQLDSLSAPSLPIPALHQQVLRAPPVVPEPSAEKPTKPEDAILKLNWLSATGTGILVSGILAGLMMGFAPAEIARVYWSTLKLVRLSLLTIAAMLALGYVTKYSGTDATLGLALSKTGALYPFFGTLLGWLGVALTGSDTASNVLFGSLQKIAAQKAGVSSVLMAAANSSGGVMGKMVDAQSIVVASTATDYYGHEDKILRFVFFHSIALAALVGLLVYLQAYVFPFSEMVVK
ncbi:MAG: lldP [Verrucomicrobiales bacterium]|nr:lldP [Verrucomicrobiales bacterium]